jgi:diguanylate cyclase (GGDEF)-like protein
MIKNLTEQIPKEDRKTFYQAISAESSSRVCSVLLALASLQAVQMVIYISGKGSILHDRELILLKVFIILFSVISYAELKILNKSNPRARGLMEPSLVGIVFVIMLWAVINTFKAQSITSDISIYILVLVAVAAVVRMRPWMTALLFGTALAVFLFGIRHFQSKPEYLTSHIMNGLILNIIAFLISFMMFRYSIIEYLDKQRSNEKNSELLYLARHDGLTSLYNHLAIYELLESAISQARIKPEPLSIMLIDLDRFKQVNDIYGHKTGDDVLRKVSECILKNIRQNDIAGRYGGDEFLIILPGSNINYTKEIAIRLLDEIRQLNFEGIGLSFSCGIAKWEGDTAEQLVDKADKVLYRVKSEGRNNVYA